MQNINLFNKYSLSAPCDGLYKADSILGIGDIKKKSIPVKLSIYISLSSASQVALVIKSPSANAGDVRDVGSVSGLGRSPGGGNGNPLQCSFLEKLHGQGTWWSTVHRVAKSQTRLK